MKLVSLNDHPEWLNVFSELHLRFLKIEDQKFFLSPEKVRQLLSLDFHVPREAFFFEDDTGEFFGGVLLTGSTLDKKRGHFSMFSYSEEQKYRDYFPKIWSQIEKWFSDYGMTEIVGPYLYTTYFPYRFRSDDNQERFTWEPNQPLFYNELILSAGFKKHESYFSNFIEDYGIFATKGEKEYEEAIKAGFKFRRLSKETLSADLKIIYDISMKSFQDNYLFMKIPYELFEKIYAPSFTSLDLGLSCIQETSDGQPVGFNFTFILDNMIVIKSVATIPEYRGKGLLNSTIRWTMLEAFKLHPSVKRVATALIHDENAASKKIANQSNEFIVHEYSLYKKVIG